MLRVMPYSSTSRMTTCDPGKLAQNSRRLDIKCRVEVREHVQCEGGTEVIEGQQKRYLQGRMLDSDGHGRRTPWSRSPYNAVDASAVVWPAVHNQAGRYRPL